MQVRYIGHATISVETSDVSLIIDPWLTFHLDRFWEHYPPLREESIPSRVDVVLLSHHHYDHCHLPSLNRLNRDAIVLFPATNPFRAVTAAGGGSLVVPWLLKRLGYNYVKGVKPFEQISFGDTTITGLPSAVSFPELTYLISNRSSNLLVAGDSMLHTEATKWLHESKVRVELAVLPIHSIATDACFTNRAGRDDVKRITGMAEKSFREYLSAFPDSAIIPGAFGWRVATSPPPFEPCHSWMNRRLFPLTVADGYRIGEDSGADIHIWGPSDVVEIDGNNPLRGGGPTWDDLGFFDTLCEEFKLDDPAVAMPPFTPEEVGPPINEGERNEIMNFVKHVLPDAISATPYLMTSIEAGRRTNLRISDHEDLSWVIDFTSGRCDVKRSEPIDSGDKIWIAERTFLSLMRSEIPYGHTWGCWVGNPALLDCLFNEPRHYLRYVESVLATPGGIERYGF